MVKKLTATTVDRVSALVGFALVVTGVALMHVPAAVILAGSMLIAGVLWRTK